MERDSYIEGIRSAWLGERLGEVFFKAMADRTDDLRSVRDQAKGLAALAAEAGLEEADVARVGTAVESLTGNLGAVEEDVLQTKNTSFYDPLDNPGKLAAELAFLYNTVAGGLGGAVSARPTDQAMDRLEELRLEVDGVLGRLQEIFDGELVELNELIRSLGMDPVVLERTGQLIS